MKKYFIIPYLIFIHIFLIIGLLKSNFIEYIRDKFYHPQNVLIPTNNYHYLRMLTYHERLDDNVPDNAVIFIGDSITQSLCVSAIASPAVNYGIGSDTTIGVIQRLPYYKSIKQARAVVIAIGINDIKWLSNAEIIKNYRLIIKQLPNEIPIIFVAILPVDEENNDKWEGYNQTRIKYLNLDIKQLTKNIDNLFFIDASPLLVDAKGNLSDIYHVGDGIHLNSKGNKILIDMLTEKLQRVQSLKKPVKD